MYRKRFDFPSIAKHSSEERLRDGAVFEVGDNDLESVGHSLGSLVLDEAWDHAGRVHMLDEVNLHAALIRLEGEVGENVVSDNVLADVGGFGRDYGLVAFARVADNLEAVGALGAVETGDNLAVGDDHRHFHFEACHSMTFIIGQGVNGQLRVDGRSDSKGVLFPSSPGLFGESIASVLDHGDASASLLIDSLLGCVVLLWLLQNRFIRVPLGEKLVSTCH